MRLNGNLEYAKILSSMKTCTKLKRLVLTVALKNELVDILNKNLSKDVGLKSLQITFASAGGNSG